MSAELPEELAAKRDDIFRHATTRGMRMRVRRRVAMGATAVVALAATVGTVAALTGNDARPRVAIAGPESTTGSVSTTTSDSSTSATTTPATDVPATSPPDTGTVPGTVAPGGTDTTVLVCHNSYDPACGPLTFTSTPDNKPLELSVQHTLAGDTVKLHIHAADDAAIEPCMRIQWGDGESANAPDRFGCTVMGTCVYQRPRYGPWDVPPPTPEAITLDFTHTYKSAGKVTVSIDAASADPCSPDQFYASDATQALHLTITTPTTTT